MKTFFLRYAVLFLAFGPGMFAKAYFQGEAEMIAKAEAIAIVTISSVRDAETQGEHWTYRQAADAKVEKTLKGELPAMFVLRGAETFICAQCPLTEGRFLVFLEKDGQLWKGSNWHLSLRPIDGARVEWFSDDPKAPGRLALAPLHVVLARIEKAVAEAASAKLKAQPEADGP